jgi:hypothetical protein
VPPLTRRQHVLVVAIPTVLMVSIVLVLGPWSFVGRVAVAAFFVALGAFLYVVKA